MNMLHCPLLGCVELAGEVSCVLCIFGGYEKCLLNNGNSVQNKSTHTLTYDLVHDHSVNPCLNYSLEVVELIAQLRGRFN